MRQRPFIADAAPLSRPVLTIQRESALVPEASVLLSLRHPMFAPDGKVYSAVYGTLITHTTINDVTHIVIGDGVTLHIPATNIVAYANTKTAIITENVFLADTPLDIPRAQQQDHVQVEP